MEEKKSFIKTILIVILVIMIMINLVSIVNGLLGGNNEFIATIATVNKVSLEREIKHVFYPEIIVHQGQQEVPDKTATVLLHILLAAEAIFFGLYGMLSMASRDAVKVMRNIFHGASWPIIIASPITAWLLNNVSNTCLQLCIILIASLGILLTGPKGMRSGIVAKVLVGIFMLPLFLLTVWVFVAPNENNAFEMIIFLLLLPLIAGATNLLIKK